MADNHDITETSETLDIEPSDSVADEWVDEYPEGAQLFCARFDAEDFKTTVYATARYPKGATIAVQVAEPPDDGFFAQNRDRTPIQLGFDVIQAHMCERAWTIFCNLLPEVREEFVERWSGDTFNRESAGKATGSNRSSRRAENKKRR